MNKPVKTAVSLVIAAAVLAGGVRYLWSIRQTKEMDREKSKTVRREFRKAPLDEAASRLEKLYTEKFFTVRFITDIRIKLRCFLFIKMTI